APERPDTAPDCRRDHTAERQRRRPMSDQLIIPGGTGPLGKVPDFPIIDRHTVFEWSLIYTDQNPLKTAGCFRNRNHNSESLEDRRVRQDILGARGSWVRVAYGNPMGLRNNPTEQVTNSVYRALAHAIEQGDIKPTLLAYCDDDPDAPDPTRHVIEQGAV